MYPDTEMMPTLCPDGSGTMPSCAPLASPYVPFQQPGGRKYDQKDALENGTLFPGLNLPFFLKRSAPDLASTPMAELQALEFVLVELGLYLDTHPDDREAFSLYQQYAALERAGREQYEARFGPLFQYDTSRAEQYRAWIKDPWPWNYEEGGK